MSSPEFKVHNKAEMPISVSIWLLPVSDDAIKPSWSQCIEPQEVHHFKHCAQGMNYKVKTIVSPDNEVHPEWNWKFPGVAEFTGLLEEGFKLWYQGGKDLDYEEIKSLSVDIQNKVFNDSTMSSMITCPTFNQTITVALSGGPHITDVDVDKRKDGDAHIITADFLKSKD